MLWYRLQVYMCVYSMCLCVSTVCRKHTSTGIYESFRLWHSDPYHKVRNTSAAAAVVVSQWPWFKKSLKLLLLNFTIIMIWNGKRLIGTNLRGSRCCYCSALAQIQTPSCHFLRSLEILLSNMCSVTFIACYNSLIAMCDPYSIEFLFPLTTVNKTLLFSTTVRLHECSQLIMQHHYN